MANVLDAAVEGVEAATQDEGSGAHMGCEIPVEVVVGHAHAALPTDTAQIKNIMLGAHICSSAPMSSTQRLRCMCFNQDASYVIYPSKECVAFVPSFSRPLTACRATHVRDVSRSRLLDVFGDALAVVF